MIRLVSILIVSLFLASCGGGGSGGVSTAVKQTTNLQATLASLIANTPNSSKISGSTSTISAMLDISNDDKTLAGDLKTAISNWEDAITIIEGWDKEYYADQMSKEQDDGKKTYEWFEIGYGGYVLLNRHRDLLDYLSNNSTIDSDDPRLLKFINDQDIKELADKDEEQIYSYFKTIASNDSKWKDKQWINPEVINTTIDEQQTITTIEENSCDNIDSHVSAIININESCTLEVTERKEPTENDDGSITTNTYRKTIATGKITTTTTVTTTITTTKTWNNGAVTFDSEVSRTQTIDEKPNTTESEELISSKTEHVIVSSDTVDDIQESTTTTQRSEILENDNGTTTTNTYEVTTVTTTTTPITTHTWSDGTTTQEQGESVETFSTSEVLVSTSTTAHVTDTYVTNVEEQTVTQGDDVVTTATTTRTETENTDDATVTRTYQVVTTTTRTPTHTTTTLTPKTVTVWSDGTETFVLGTPVTETVTTWAESNTSTETLIATNSVPIGTQFLTDEYNRTALSQINASYAYDRGWTGDGVTVGIVDSGIDTDHEDFDSDRFSTINYRFAGTEDDNGHGTHVAGIIAATKNDLGTHGVAYDADVISIKLCFSSGNCSAGYFDDAMLELSRQGVTVANLSANTSTTILTQIGDTDAYYLSGQSSMDGIADSTLLNYQSAIDNGMIIVNSAGNYGLDYPMMPSHYATRVDSDGNLYLNGQWLIVGAVDSNNQIASWSNKAGHICSNVVYTDGVATGCDDTFNTKDFFVVAPGVNILSTANGGGTTTMSGTSMAAPYVTGSIAVLKQAWPQLQPEQLVGLITSTAQDLGDPGVDAVYGHGLVDLNEATKPQGDIVAVQPSGAISQVSGGIVGDSSLSGLDDIAGLSSIMVFDAYQRDYYVDDDNFTQFEIVERPLASSFAGYESMETLVGDGMTFAMSSSGDDWQYGQTVEHSDNLDITYNVGMINQDGSLYGSSFQGLFAIDSSQTQFVGLDMSYSLTDNWNWIGSYHRGFSDINSASDSYITGSTDIQSQTWYAGVSYTQDHDSFDFKFGQQLGIVQGSINYNLPTSYDWQTDTTEFTSGSASAQSSQTPQVIEFAYKKQITDSWEFNTNSRYTFVANDNILTANIGVEYTW